MTLDKNTQKAISDILKEVIEKKLLTYKPETLHKPFHYCLLGHARYALCGFLHSMNTTFGMSIWEQVAVVLAQNVHVDASRQFKLLGKIDAVTESVLSSIMYKLRKSEVDTDVQNETELIRNSIKKGEPEKHPDSTVDLHIRTKSNETLLFYITSAEPNFEELVLFKEKLLRWKALHLSQNKNASVSSCLAIPYNPYYPEPYERWILRGLYDLPNNEVMIGEDFWNFVGGGEIYNDLLDVFQTAGNEMREKIDEKMEEFKTLTN